MWECLFVCILLKFRIWLRAALTNKKGHDIISSLIFLQSFPLCATWFLLITLGFGLGNFVFGWVELNRSDLFLHINVAPSHGKVWRSNGNQNEACLSFFKLELESETWSQFWSTFYTVDRLGLSFFDSIYSSIFHTGHFFVVSYCGKCWCLTSYFSLTYDIVMFNR